MQAHKTVQRLFPNLSHSAPRACSRLRILTSLPQIAPQSRPPFPQAPLHLQTSSQRPYSTSLPSIKSYTYEDILSHTTAPSPHRILIDVREPSELQHTGYIPTAFNLPIKSHPEAVFLKPEEFEERFGWEKPGPETEAVFYCLAGVRSRAAARMAKEAGWSVGEYVGSWREWSERGGKVEGGMGGKGA